MTRYVLACCRSCWDLPLRPQPHRPIVLVHGKIHTEDAKRSVVQALAVRGTASCGRHR